MTVKKDTRNATASQTLVVRAGSFPLVATQVILLSFALCACLMCLFVCLCVGGGRTGVPHPAKRIVVSQQVCTHLDFITVYHSLLPIILLFVLLFL